jgi:hypothetical protein
MEGSGYALIEILFGNILRGRERNHKTPVYIYIAGVLLDIRSEILPRQVCITGFLDFVYRPEF